MEVNAHVMANNYNLTDCGGFACISLSKNVCIRVWVVGIKAVSDHLFLSTYPHGAVVTATLPSAVVLLVLVQCESNTDCNIYILLFLFIIVFSIECIYFAYIIQII